MAKARLADFDAAVHHETDKAYLVSTTGTRSDAVWVPKSRCEFEPGPETFGRSGWGTMTMPEELALEKGLI